ncbi:precorrin-3B C(17)-methyltransferase [candidate division KSB1 bacterium]|nr:precorrin-3B C(17)-methyltransferase [candidate division KSB1 bacterium]
MAKIFSIGIGPGHLDLMTIRARDVLQHCDSVVGYVRFIRLVEPLIRDKEVYSNALHQEDERAHKAIELARAGKNVAVISSGDSGVYGMAVLLQKLLPMNEDISLEIIPGITAGLAGASLVGTPLSSDFAVLSLSEDYSDLATILYRARLYAQANVTVVLYNPGETADKPGVLSEVIDIFRHHRPPEIPVAIVQKAYRSTQSIEILTLENFAVDKMDVNSTIFICSDECKIFDDRILGKRGYVI